MDVYCLKVFTYSSSDLATQNIYAFSTISKIKYKRLNSAHSVLTNLIMKEPLTSYYKIKIQILFLRHNQYVVMLTCWSRGVTANLDCNPVQVHYCILWWHLIWGHVAVPNPHVMLTPTLKRNYFHSIACVVNGVDFCCVSIHWASVILYVTGLRPVRWNKCNVWSVEASVFLSSKIGERPAVDTSISWGIQGPYWGRCLRRTCCRDLGWGYCVILSII